MSRVNPEYLSQARALIGLAGIISDHEQSHDGPVLSEPAPHAEDPFAVEFEEAPATVDAATSFAAWATELQAGGIDLTVPANFGELLWQQRGRGLTVARLREVHQVVRQIMVLGRHALQVDLSGKTRALAPFLDRLDWEWEAGAGVGTDLSRVRAGVADAATALRAAAELIEQVQDAGILRALLIEPIERASRAADTLRQSLLSQLDQAIEAVPEPRRKRWRERVSVPELGHGGTDTSHTLVRQQLIAAALHAGDAAWLDTIAEARGWRPEALRVVFARTLDEADWRFVAAVTHLAQPLWQAIDQLEAEVNGLATRAVSPKEMSIHGSRFRLTPFPPLVARDELAKTEGGLFAPDYLRATERHFDRAPYPLLQLGAIRRHLCELAHDVTHRSALVQAMRVLDADPVARKMDPELRRDLTACFSTIANSLADASAPLEALGEFTMRSRANATMLGLGWRMTQLVAQRSGYFDLMRAAGAVHCCSALRLIARDPLALDAFVGARSPLMRERLSHGPITGDAWAHAAELSLALAAWTAHFFAASARGADEGSAARAADAGVRQVAGGSGFSQDPDVDDHVARMDQLIGTLIEHDPAQSSFCYGWWLVAVPPMLPRLIDDTPAADADWGDWSLATATLHMLGTLPADAHPPACDLPENAAHNPLSSGPPLARQRRAALPLEESLLDDARHALVALARGRVDPSLLWGGTN